MSQDLEGPAQGLVDGWSCGEAEVFESPLAVPADMPAMAEIDYPRFRNALISSGASIEAGLPSLTGVVVVDTDH